MKDLITRELTEAQEVLSNFLQSASNIQKIEKTAKLIADSIKSGGKIISCGNGGSHSEAMHFAAELTGRYRENRKPLPAIAIADSSHITSVANDFEFDQIFSKYVEGLGKPGDVLLGISTSGNSENILKAFEVAQNNGLKTVALTGNDGGKIASIADIEIRAPHHGYADRIQEIHMKVIHILILLIEELTIK